MSRPLFTTAVFVASLLATGLVGCTSEAPERPSASQTAPVVETVNGTQGQLIPIASDNVAYAGYDEDSLEMTVMFDNGSTYAYFNVPAALWLRFIEAQPHPWSQVGYPELVRGGYSYAKISD